MFGNIVNNIAKLFGGNAAEKAMKEIMPIVAQINEHFESYKSISTDELRGKTAEFKSRIADYLQDIDQQIADANARILALDAQAIDEKEEIFQEITDLEKSRDEKLEEILKEMLPRKQQED